jgi:ubiquinone/menaquinone biosynthesis C-methylase UbiE
MQYLSLRSLCCRTLWCAVLLLPAPCALAQRRSEESEKAPPAQTHYLGRKIADTMHHTGAPWLTRDNREEEERCSLMLTNLGIKPGMTVCDMGCGNGYYTLQLAKLVGPNGRVLAVDVQPEMLKLLEQRAAQAGVRNVVLVQGQLHDPKLPRGDVDLFLLVDVYHEFSHPQQMLEAMRRALSANGVVVLVEYREEDPQVPIKPLHKMSKRQILKELEANGLQLVKEYDGLPWQHMLFFGREKTSREGS